MRNVTGGIQTGENFTSVLALCFKAHFFSLYFLSVLHFVDDDVDALKKNIYVNASPIEKTLLWNMCALKHNATANRVM